MFILGLIFGAIIIFCLTYASLKKISVRWWEWILGILGIALLYFAILNFDGGLYEQTTQAAWMFLLVFAIPAIILLAVPAYLVFKRNNA